MSASLILIAGGDFWSRLPGRSYFSTTGREGTSVFLRTHECVIGRCVLARAIAVSIGERAETVVVCAATQATAGVAVALLAGNVLIVTSIWIT